MKLEAVRQELTRLETLWRQANEKELPEETYRVQAEAKREELKTLMAQFTKQQQEGSTVKRHAPAKQHYLPAKEHATGADPFAAMSRHRSGANH